jgi:hypothetical protein
MFVHLLKQTWTVTWRIMFFFVMWAGLAAIFIVPAIKKTAPNGGALPLLVRLYLETASMVTVLFSAWVMVRFMTGVPLLLSAWRETILFEIPLLDW